MRIACVVVPDFTVWALRRHHPELCGLPVVVTTCGVRRVVRALSAEARASGLRPGMTLAAAEAVLPTARLLALESGLEQQEAERLSRLLLTFTPGVEVRARTEPGEFLSFLDLRGLGRLHDCEDALARRVRAALGEHGYPSGVGVAGTKFAAQVAARESRGNVLLVPARGERAFLAPLPISHLPFAAATLEEVLALGLATLGQWADLPPETVTARFGAHGLSLHELARGDDPTPLVPTRVRDALETQVDLDDAVADLEQLAFPLKRAVDALLGKLVGRGLATSALRLTLVLEDRSRAVRETRFVRPTLAPRLLLDCLRLRLAREPLTAAVQGFVLEALETAPARAEQLLLFARRHAASDPAAVEEALSRVRALAGPGGLASPRPGNSHRPEARVEWQPYVFAPAAPLAAHGRRLDPETRPPAFGALPTRLYHEPLPAEVKSTGDVPTFVVAGELRGRVARVEGPHVVDGDWWGSGYERAYYTLTLGDGGRYWIFRDLLAGRWYLHGVFD